MKRLSLSGTFAALLCAQLLAITGVNAQAFPNRLVKIVVPYAAGGSTDGAARGLAQRLTESWGQPVVIENRPGAGTTIGADFVAKAAPDGYTLLFSDHPTYVVSPHLYSKLNYNPFTDLAPITVVFHSSPVLVMANAVPAGNFREFLAYAKANPGKLSYGSFGYGSNPHVAIENLKKMAGIDLVHVPYKGGSPALTDLLAGRVALLLGTYSFWEPHEKAGKLKVIAAVTEKRLKVRPDLPTVAESGVPGFFINTWFALAATGGTPAPVLDKINADVVKVLQDPVFNEKFMKPKAYEPGGNSREAFTAMLKTEYAHWGRLVKESGAKVE